MKITAKNFLGASLSAEGSHTFSACNPATEEALAPAFTEATAIEVNQAVEMAENAFLPYSEKSAADRAHFLETVADAILALGDFLIDRAMLETGLPKARLVGERGRTVGQLRLFASLLREGSWVDARIEHAQPDRQPLPKPDIRSMEQPLGPVGIFGASNFPLAFSVAGGDTASALAAGCPVVVKAHPAHPGTCDLVAQAITSAIRQCNLPGGVFSMVQGTSPEVGMAVVNHPLIKAIGFTGSLRGGRAIFNAAAARLEPIPVYAEMGSSNPVFLLPGAIHEKKDAIVAGMIFSVTLGVGQFCTNPGIVVMEKSEASLLLLQEAAEAMRAAGPGTMLTCAIQGNFNEGLERLASFEGVEVLARGRGQGAGCEGVAALLETSGVSFLNQPALEEEVFGPSTLVVLADDNDQLLEIAGKLKGHLTATVWATDLDLQKNENLLSRLQRKAGRLIINSWPTGVEVCHAMVHGGPYPATTDSRSTSVGTAAITRFTRPVCYQGFPDSILPDALRESNPLGINRLVDGERQ